MIFINDKRLPSILTGEIYDYITKNGIPVEVTTEQGLEFFSKIGTPVPVSPDVSATINIPGL